ncbi:UDP-glucose/GDP-mannose dehydrogenase family protein [Peribacillus frigoritolerans]|uniref:UDP-glucose dehydrogenase family protein n=1 Tax=Peribacillus frigoritolerans TaxID=450367 RepID=UPI0021D0D37B|nr:UDP-glucose/GDP-mannose dehydrogenase family protein [Peribacillus frigoritolerans]MCU6600454.1 UDP-glucose/GDP-mannose dehydrogenase family protein [Peribacillus frigoritolerans]
MNIAVVGTGYVGLVTGVGLSEIGHHVVCIDTDSEKIKKMSNGQSPIFEPDLENLMVKNISEGRLKFTSNHSKAFKDVDIIYIAVGTPENEDGTADLSYVDQVIVNISQNIENDIILVTKSTVPVGTNEYIRSELRKKIPAFLKVEVVSNPEFLREGSAVYDIFHGDRIVIGSDNKDALNVIREVNEPFGIPIFETDIRSAEMIKYASNAFLATKISFINEIANICEKVGADVDEVANGMGMDSRVGNQFLKAGIGYGGSCFPKDTNALKKIAEHVEYEFSLLSAVIEFNNKQQRRLLEFIPNDFPSLENKNIGVLGLAFKPNTDDIRESASLLVIPELLEMGSNVKVYDPAAIKNAKNLLSKEVQFCDNYIDVIKDSDLVFILTDWDEFKSIPIETYIKYMNVPNIYDGRNCYSINEIKDQPVNYKSIGRVTVNNLIENHVKTK